VAPEEYKLSHDGETTVDHEAQPWELEASMDDVIKLTPIEDRAITDTSETSWQMPRLLIKDPTLIDVPGIAERAKAEMVRFTTRHSNNGRADGRNETGTPIGDFFASFGTIQERGLHHFNPSLEIPFIDPSNPRQPNWQFALANGSFGRIQGLTKSSYAAPSRPSIKTAV